MSTALLGAVIALAVVLAVLLGIFAYLRRQQLKDPTRGQWNTAGFVFPVNAKIRFSLAKSRFVGLQLRALQRASADWSIPYDELEFGRLLGKGSQGEVFLGTWQGTPVAVKKVDTSKVDPDIMEEFFTEAEIMRRLRHPNVTLFLGISVKHPHLCIVTEFVQRGSLFDLLRDESAPLTWKRCLRLALDVAEGMKYLHEYKPAILHRDLKSLNILVDSQWRAKVADFGMTRFEGDDTMTQCGSPLWMAPEMIRNVKYNEKADVYSFGICLWELYTKKIPYRGSGLNPSTLVVKVVKEDLRPELPLRCPLTYVKLYTRCVAPSDRMRPTFRQICKVLKSAMRDPAVMLHKPMSERREVLAPKKPGVEDDEDEDEEDEEDAEGGAENGAADERKNKKKKKRKKKRKKKKKMKKGKRGSENVSSLQRRSWQIDYEADLRVHDMFRAGQSATVYQGVFRGKVVAVKQWAPNPSALQSNSGVRQRIAAIMESLVDLRHPNIVLFMGAYIEPDHVGMVTEFMDYGDLHTLVQDSATVLSWDMMLQFLIDAAQGMAYLHGHKPPIAHGDLKTSRLLVDGNWRVKVGSYGIVSFDSSIQQVSNSAWTAPEVLVDPSCGDLRSNSYSFGMIMWEILARRLPYSGAEFTTLDEENVLHGSRPYMPPNVPPTLDGLIRACWDADPTKRPSFTTIVETLQQAKKDGPPKLVLDDDNSKQYRKSMTVHAYRSTDAITILKDWGKNSGEAGCYVILSGEDDVYCTSAEVFQATYEPVRGHPNEYRKTGTIRAKKMSYPFAIRVGDDETEQGLCGDFLVQDSKGAQWVIEGAKFEELYEEV